MRFMSEADWVRLERSLGGLARRMLVLLNFASIHPTSLVNCVSTLRNVFPITHHALANVHASIVPSALFLLTRNVLNPLRQGVETAVAEKGWTKL